MVVREKQRIDQGSVVSGETPVIPVRRRRQRVDADTLPQQRYDGVIGVSGSSANGAQHTAARQALLRLDREVKRQRAAARPEIDLAPGSMTMTTMEHIGRGLGVELEALKRDLRDVFKVSSLANIGNLGPASASKSSTAIEGLGALTVARDIGHDFPDVIRATVKKLATFQGQEDALLGQIAGRNDRKGHTYAGPSETTPLFVKAAWAYCSLYPSSRFIEEEITADPIVQKRSGQKTLRETVNAALIWTIEKLKTDSSPRFIAAAYDALVYGADLMRQAPGPKGPMAEASIAAAEVLEDRAKELQAQFLASFEAKSVSGADLGALLDSRLLVGEAADQARSLLIEKVRKREIGSIADEMAVVHGMIRHGEIDLATEAARGVVKAAAEDHKSATSVSAAWASLSWLAHQALTRGTFVEISATEKPERPIRVLIGAGDLELSEQRRSIGLGVAQA